MSDRTDILLRHRVLALGYARSVADELIAFLDATEPQIRRALLEIFSTPGLRVNSRLRRAEDQVVGFRTKAWNRLSTAAIAALVSLAQYEPVILKSAIGRVLTVPSLGSLNRLARTTLIAGSKITEWLKSMRDMDIKRLVAQLRIGILSGESVGDVLKRITGRLSPVAGAVKNALRMVVDTATGAITNAVKTAVLGLGNALFPQWELWVSILDARTSPGCRELDGKVFRVGEGPMPGYHPFCRSERVPIDDPNDAESETPDSYKSWISTQPSWFVKYAGTVLTVATLRPLTLIQMKQMEAV